MKMVIGGAYQGKLEYALKWTGYKKEDFLDGGFCGPEEIFEAKGINRFHEYVKRYLEQREDWEGFVKELFERNPDLVVVTNELGYGVVPCDASDRRWREATGRICTELAKNARAVTRVVCGIGMVLKNETDSND